MKKVLILMIIIALFLNACSNQPVENELDQGDQVVENTNNGLDQETAPEIVEDINEPEETIPIEENVPEVDLSEYPIQLTLEKLENSVKLTWTKYEGDYEFFSYKVSRSVVDSNPVYPGNTLRKTIANIDELEYIDTLPEGGVSYYVVTAIGPLNQKTHSNPVMVEFPNLKETPDQEIKLTATNTKDGVLLKWDKYNGDFLFYKVVWTTDHPNPKYPDDSTIATIAYVNETEYLHTRAESGMNYYAVTVVRPNKTRFTSERAYVNIE